MEFNDLLTILQKNYPKLVFQPGRHFAWNSEKSQITYKKPGGSKQANKFSNKLLHELAHARLNHSDYKSDAELLKIESAAWELAKELCKEYAIHFETKEQDGSLASYTAWASSRSQCPKCKKNGLQTTSSAFVCPNCSHKWNVGKSRFTRTYRH